MKAKKVVPEVEQPEEPYFVSLKNPLELRRQLLESSKKSLFCLQNYQRILLLRQQKLKEMANLKENIKELSYLNKKFNQKLPAYYDELLKEKAKEKDAPPVVEPKKVVKPVKEKSELEKLEESLSAIEDKLKNLKS